MAEERPFDTPLPAHALQACIHEEECANAT